MGDDSADAIPRTFAKAWFAPVLGPLLRQRKLSGILAAVGVLQVAAGMFRFHTFPCPMLYGTGIPCPGCGASRACAAFLRRDCHNYLALHAMAPAFLGAVILFAVAAVLPDTTRVRLAAWADGVEARTGLLKMLLATMMFYWLGRLLYDPHAYIELMRAG
jgi:hypothetical protein